MADVEEVIKRDAEKAVILQNNLVEATQEIKALQDKVDSAWRQVEALMIEKDIKSIKSDKWGSVTIAEKLGWTTTDELPSKFYKKVVDLKRLSDTFRLEGKAPKGAEPKYTKYLTKRLKQWPTQ
jgi:hypothetical protein